MTPSKRGKCYRGRTPRIIAKATAAAAAGAVYMYSPPLSAVEATFSAPAFTSRIHPTSSESARFTSRTGVATSSAPCAVQGSASTADQLLRRRLPTHRSCHPPYSFLSMEQVLGTHASKLKQSNVIALQQGKPLNLRQKKASTFGSLSGRYGGLESSPTSLSVSPSSNVLGFRVEDFEPYNSNNNDGDENDDELQFSIENFDYFQDDIESSFLEKGQGRVPVVRTLDPRMASPTSQRIAASLLNNGSTTRLGRDLATNKNKNNNHSNKIIVSSSRSLRPPHKSKANSEKSNLIGEKEDLPPWFPWVPTESQINSLKVVELRAACAERELLTTGKKAELQNRLLIWATVQDRKRVKDRLSGLRDLIRVSKGEDLSTAGSKAAASAAGAVAESYDVGALTSKRKALTKEKKRSRKNNNRGVLGLVDESYFNATVVTSTEIEGEEEEEEKEIEEEDNSMVNEASIDQLSKTFNAPSSNFTNREVREMYIEARRADQTGDRKRSKAILARLREATPHDMRVVRRLSRMESEDDNLAAARSILQRGLQSEPDNAHLLHGMGQLERRAGNDYTAKKYFRRALKRDPSFPNPYHALGTLEHTHGNIRAALAVIKEGIQHCPTNHRLYHALGDVYLDANMLDLAEESYLAGLQHGPHWSKSFFYTSLSFVSYALGHTRDCRTLLRQSLEANGGMHAQGVIALAQLEESEGNVQEAREVYRDAISRYEKRRRKRSHFRHRPKKPSNENKGEEEEASAFDTSSLVDGRGNPYSRSYAGDKWINVFKSWARMEEVHGTYETAHIVYSKAARLFPDNVGLLMQWAELQSEHGDVERARLLYEAACHRVGGRNAEPYREFATFEMKRKNFVEAQTVLLRGARARAESSRGGNGRSSLALARLLHTWGVCEYHLGSLARAEQLFDDALRVTGPEEGDSAMRSLVLYSMARLEFARGEYLLAQHCIGLSLKENLLPGGNSPMWKMWYRIATEMGNEHLATRCKEQALLRWEEERGGAVSDLSRLLGGRKRRRDYSDDKLPSSSNDDDDERVLPERTGSAMKDVFRKAPWYSKVCPPSGRMDKNWYSGAKLWEL